MFVHRVSSCAFLLLAAAVCADAQCYVFSGSGVTLQVNITNINFQTGPTSVAGGRQTDYVFSGDNSLTIGGSTLTSVSTIDGAADIQYIPAVGNFPDVTTFTIAVPDNTTVNGRRSGDHTWVAYLFGTGDLI